MDKIFYISKKRQEIFLGNNYQRDLGKFVEKLLQVY